MAPFFNDVRPDHLTSATADSTKQKYVLTVNLWSDWFRAEGHDPTHPDVELPPEIYQPILSDAEGVDEEEEEEEEEWDWDNADWDEDDEEEDIDYSDEDEDIELPRPRIQRIW